MFIKDAKGAYVQREVKVGARMDRQVEILEGLEPGMQVVISGAMLLKSQVMKGQDN